MNQPPFTIRIRTEQEQDMDWMVQPNAISFHQALEVIAQVLPQTSVTAFELLWDPEWRRHTVWTSTSPDYLPQSWENSSKQKQIWIKDRYSSQCPVIQTSSNRQTHPETKSETKDRHNKRKSSPFTVTSQWSKHSRCTHNTGSPESDTRRFPPADWAGSKDFTDAWRRKWRPSL